MILSVIAWIAIFFLLVRLIVVLVNLITWPLLPAKGASAEPFVSILIPARNEEKNILNLLNGLENQQYTNIEIIVYDDESTDNTYQTVKSFSEKTEIAVSILKGKGLPSGWLGKNHGCYQMARQAAGDFLLFLDADVIIDDNLLSDAIGYVKNHNLDLLSIFPRQLMFSWGEKLTVPLMNWILVSFLPLRLIQYNQRPAFSAANGQFMLFKTEAYKQHNFHQMFKNNPVEDIAIQRRMKELNLKTATLLSNGQIKCRMYHNFQDGVHGFSKNFIQFFGGSSILLTFFLLIISVGPLALFLSFGLIGFLLYLAGILALRSMVAVLSRQPLWIHMLLSPLHFLATWIISLKAIYVKKSGKLNWKERQLSIK